MDGRGNAWRQEPREPIRAREGLEPAGQSNASVYVQGAADARTRERTRTWRGKRLRTFIYVLAVLGGEPVRWTICVINAEIGNRVYGLRPSSCALSVRAIFLNLQ